MKVYVSDRVVPYKTTTIPAASSKAEIDGILARWGVKDVAWRWDLQNGDVFLQFAINETIDGHPLNTVVKIEPPRIWNPATKKHLKEDINWNVSMRVMFWYIKTHLEMSYLMQSAKIIEFLPHMLIPALEGDKPLKDMIIPAIESLKALPQLSEEKARRIIEVPEE